MRAAWVLLAVLLAGCATPPSDGPATNGTDTAAPSPDANATAPPAPVGDRMPSRMEEFVFLPNRTLGFLREGETLAEERIPEPVAGLAFYTGQSGQAPALAPFVSPPFGVPFETSAEFEITMRLVASAHAVPSFPPVPEFPNVGGWFGTPERYAHFVGARELPSTLEPNVVYTVKIAVPLAKGGFFVRAGESLAFTPYVNYQAVDNSPIMWVVGGAEPAGFPLPHSHFNVSAPRATVILDERGETGPNPTPSGDQNPQPANLPFKVPLDAVYVVLEVEGAPKAGPVIDIDGSIRTPGGEVLAAGSSPYAREVAVIGPGALAAAGRDLVAHVTSGSNASGGTFSVKVTAYAP